MHLDVDVEFGIDPVFLNRSTEMVVTKVARAAVSVEVSRKGSSLESGELEPDPFLLSKQQTRQSVTRQCFHEEPQKKKSRCCNPMSPLDCIIGFRLRRHLAVERRFLPPTTDSD